MKKAIGKVVSVLAGGAAGAVAGSAAMNSVMGKKLKDKNEWFKKVVSYYHL